jgi:hypothetical protein
MKKQLLLVVPWLSACSGVVDFGAVPEPGCPQPKPRVLQMQPWAGGMCGLFDDEKVRCWKTDGSGAAIEAPGLRGVKFAGTDYSGEHGLLCVVDHEGNLNCIDAMCATFTTSDVCGPTGTPHSIAVGAPITDVSVGLWGGVALLPDGTFQPWGGAIPDCFNPPNRPPGPRYGDFAYDWVLDPVSLPSPIVGVDIERRLACFVGSNGRVWCTAANLTTGPTCAWPPEPLPDVDDAVAVVTSDPTCILHRSGDVSCYGDAALLGIGATNYDLSAGMAAGIDDAIELRGYSGTTCVIRSDRSLWCWGDNQLGQAGAEPANTDPSIVYLPQRVEAVSDVRALGMANMFTCAAVASGDIWCWGGTAGYRPFPVRL